MFFKCFKFKYLPLHHPCFNQLFPVICFISIKTSLIIFLIGPRSTVGNVSGKRCESDCRSRGRKFDPGPFQYFHGDWLWNNFYGHSPPFCWIIQEGLMSVTSKSMCTKYWLTACSSLSRKKVWWTDCTAKTIAVDLGRKASQQITNKQNHLFS